ncbi:phosphatase 2C-like domain-containing protein [Rhizophagus diaphanus]|nr:phosphatase 2C-like domain-containing protein [Rhizophagus diaphanus] [Rhizophagus sp. MUCL 43196]
MNNMANFNIIIPFITKKFNSRHSLSLLQIMRNFNHSSILRSQEYYLVKSHHGENYRLHLSKSRHLVGIRSTRGIRELNEDRYQAMVLKLSDNGKNLKDDIVVNQPILDVKNIENPKINGEEAQSNQSCYFAVFDGHGGPQCADYLTATLHKNIEDVKASDADNIITSLRSVGGYFVRFKPASLEMLLSPEVADISKKRPNNQKSNSRKFSSTPTSQLLSPSTLQQPSTQALLPSLSPLSPTALTSLPPKTLTMEQRLLLAFLKTDSELMEDKSVGSTASIALIKSLDKLPFWTSNSLEISIAHVGDTKILLCEVEKGNSIPLTYDHHPSSIVETDRLRKSGGFIITDSFGSEMYLGRLANSRSFGDFKLKRFGVSAEPEISTLNLSGKDFAFMVLVSDGVTSVLSDQEIVDCIKNYNDPTLGASKLVDLAEELGSDDNITAMVVRLPGWGSPMSDQTKDLREYRLERNSTFYNRRT